MLYGVSYEEVERVLKTAFKKNSVSMLHSFQQYLPINIAGEERTVNAVLQETLIETDAAKDGTKTIFRFGKW